MSNIGKRLIHLKPGVQITVENGKIIVSGSKGTLESVMPQGVELDIQDQTVAVKRTSNEKETKRFFGLTRSLVANMVQGVADGFEKKLELSGVGYRARVEGRDLVLNVGYADPVRLTPPENISFAVAENVISVIGVNKEIVGNTAAKVREVRPPDPYKAKGIKYAGEIIKKKAGKSAKAK